MPAIISAINYPEAPESDYGSDFSVEEESIVIQLLETIQKEGPFSQCGRGNCAPQADVDAAVAAGILVSSPFEKLDREDVVAPEVVVEVGPERRGLFGQAKTPAPIHGSFPSSGLEKSSEIRSLPLDGIQYPDCT